MTRQNAINRLKVIQEYYRKEGGYLSIANVIALDLAIDSLKAGTKETIKKVGKPIMKKEQEIVRSVFDAYIREAKSISAKKDRPTFDMLEKVKNMAIKALEQPTQRWVPVSERLPENEGLCKEYESPVLSNDDFEFIKVLEKIKKTKYKFIAKSASGHITFFTRKPHISPQPIRTGNYYYYTNKKNYAVFFEDANDLFQGIKSKDGLYDIENKCFIKGRCCNGMS